MPSMRSLENCVAAQVAEFQPRYIRVMELQWLMSTTGKSEYQDALVQETKQLRERLSQPERLNELTTLLQRDTDAQDAWVLRQAILLRNEFAANQADPALLNQISDLEAHVQQTFANFRATVDGTPMLDNDLKAILHHSDDVTLRHKAWQASKQIGMQVSATVRQLARLRNQIAQQAGFANYYVMRLELDELSEREVFDLFESLDSAIAPAWQHYKHSLDAQLAQRFKIDLGDLQPWHYGDPFFQEPQPSSINLDGYFADKDLVKLTRDYFEQIGFEIDDILQRSDLFEREGKEQHAFCANIDHAGDIRVLCNNRPGVYWMTTMLHEFGHAVYDKYADARLPYLLRGPAHVLTTEAIAIMSGDLTQSAAWLARYAGVPQAEAAQLESALADEQRHSRMLFARWVSVMSQFERALYQDPEQDLNTLWWDLVERYQNIRRPAHLSGHEWASKIHIACFPAYYHNYLLGAMISAQLHAHMLEHIAGGSPETLVSDTRVGQFMTERLFRPGGERDWRGWLLHATGKPLSAEAYGRMLTHSLR